MDECKLGKTMITWHKMGHPTGERMSMLRRIRLCRTLLASTWLDGGEYLDLGAWLTG